MRGAGDAGAEVAVGDDQIRDAVVIRVDGRHDLEVLDAESRGDFGFRVLAGAGLNGPDGFRGNQLGCCGRLVRKDCRREIRSCQVDTAELIRHRDRAERRTEIVGAGSDKNHLAATFLVDKPRNLCATDTQACRGQVDLHCLGAGLCQLSGHKTESALGDVGGHGTGLCRRIINEFVDHQPGAAAKREYRLVDKHDLHATTRSDLDLVTQEDLRAGCDPSDVRVALNSRYADDIATQGGCHTDEFGGRGGGHDSR